MSRVLILLSFLLLLGAAPIQVTDVVWKDGPPTLPKGTKMAVLEGDPRATGLFTIRLNVPAGTKIGPHFHRQDERVTVLSGRVLVGFGDVQDDTKSKSFPAGSFYVNPANSNHYLSVPEDTVLQLTCNGPWELIPVAAP